MKKGILSAIIVALIFFLFGFRVFLSVEHRFDPDEFEHIHAAWCIKQGQIIYKDFFEHHPPLFYFTILPLLHLHEGITGLTLCRIAMLPFAFSILIPDLLNSQKTQ